MQELSEKKLIGTAIVQAEQKVAEGLLNLVNYYSPFFNQNQIDSLIYFWYGMSKEEVAESQGLSLSVIGNWLQDTKFIQAIEAGKYKRREILAHGMENLGILAYKKLKDNLTMDIDPESRAYAEQIKTARWVMDSMNLGMGDSTDKNKESSSINEETARMIAEQLKNIKIESKPSEKMSDLWKEDNVVDGKIVDPIVFYRKVDTTEINSEYGYVNIHKDTCKLQCHICGSWFTSIASHLAAGAHTGINGTTYKRHFGLSELVQLTVTDEILEKLAESKE